jgi:cell division protein FtsL
MLKILKGFDAIIAIIFLTIIVGIIVITMRSKTYSVGYEIAALKSKEKSLRQRQIELQSDLAATERNVRDNLLAQKDSSGKPKFILPDPKRVLRTEQVVLH